MESIKNKVLLQSVIIFYLVLIVLSPSIQLMPKYIYLHDGQRLLALLLLLVTLIYNAFNSATINNAIPIPQNVRWAFIILLALSTLSTAQSHFPRHAVIEFSIFASLCYISLVTASLYLKNKELFIKAITYVLWASVLLYMFGFYVGYITASISKTPLLWPQPFLGFTNIRLFNQYQLWSIGLITLPILAFNLKRNTKIWLSMALTIWWVLLYYSSSRGVLIAWFIGIFFTVITYKKLALPFLKLQLISAITGFFSYYLLFKIIPGILQQEVVTGTLIRNNFSDRTELWNICIQMIKTHPFLGVGPQHYFWYTKLGTHPHNSILQLGAEWGLPATVIMLGIAGYGFYCWYNKFNAAALYVKTKLDSTVSIILFFTIIANAAYSLVDGVIVMPISQVLMFTIIGLMLGQSLHGKITDASNTQQRVIFRPIFASIVLIALVWSNMPEIIQGLSGNPRGFSSGPHIVNPRIWVQPRQS
jgi:putative inorganic carbon (hco3(-)) transporter